MDNTKKVIINITLALRKIQFYFGVQRVHTHISRDLLVLATTFHCVVCCERMQRKKVQCGKKSRKKEKGSEKVCIKCVVKIEWVTKK